MKNFKALDDAVKKPEVAILYADLDYHTKLDFVDNVEPPLQNVTEILGRTIVLVESLQNQFDEVLRNNDQSSGAKVTDINKQLRENEELQIIAQQEGEVRTQLEDLVTRRKRFGDCNIRSCLSIRQ